MGLFVSDGITDGTFRAQDLGEEYLIYDPEEDRLHVLNRTAREIFLLCDGTRSEVEVAAELCDRFDVDPATAANDARRTIVELLELGILNER